MNITYILKYKAQLKKKAIFMYGHVCQRNLPHQQLNKVINQGKFQRLL